MVAIIANTTPVSFGTVGTPTITGVGSSLNTPDVVDDHCGGLSFGEFVHQIGIWTALAQYREF